MSFDWPYVRLGDHCSKIGSGATPKGGKNVYLEKGDISLIRSQNVYNHGFKPEGLVYLTNNAAEKLENVSVLPGDILLNITGDSVARVCLAPNDYLPARVNQHVAIIRPNPDVFDSRFIRYLLSSSAYQNHLLTLASSGATRNALTKGNIEALEVVKPSLSVQKWIADQLESLDKKIEINNEINQTIEEMAQAMFKSWFVNFEPVKAKILVLETGGSQEEATLAAMTAISGKDTDALLMFERERREQYFELKSTAELFPSGMKESDLGNIPAGWMVNPASTHYDISIGKTPPRKETHWFSTTNDGVKWVSIRDMGIASTYISETSERLTHDAVENFNIKVMPAGTVFLSFKLTIGRICITTENMCSNEAIAHFTAKNDRYKNYWLYHALKSFNFNQLGSTSSIATAVNSKTIRDMRIIFPSEEISQKFIEKVSPLMKLQQEISGQISCLLQLRAALLPKFLSGEIDVPEKSKPLNIKTEEA